MFPFLEGGCHFLIFIDSANMHTMFCRVDMHIQTKIMLDRY